MQGVRKGVFPPQSRPIFVGDRIFALLGYELVEGAPQARGIAEIQRVNFASVLPIH